MATDGSTRYEKRYSISLLIIDLLRIQGKTEQAKFWMFLKDQSSYTSVPLYQYYGRC